MSGAMTRRVATWGSGRRAAAPVEPLTPMDPNYFMVNTNDYWPNYYWVFNYWAAYGVGARAPSPLMAFQLVTKDGLVKLLRDENDRLYQLWQTDKGRLSKLLRDTKDRLIKWLHP